MKINIGFYHRVFFYPLFIILLLLLLLFVFASLFNSKTIERKNVLGLVAMILTSKEEFLQLLKFVVEGALVFFLEW